LDLAEVSATGGNVATRLRPWLIGGVVSAAALAVALWGVRPDRFFEHLRQGQYAYLLPCAVLLILGLAFRARSWHVLLEGMVPFGRAFSSLNEGYLLNTVLPLRLGELARAYAVSRGGSLSAGRALATVVLERLIDVVVSLAGLALALPFVAAPGWARDIAWGAGAFLALLVLGLGIALSQRRNLAGLLGRLPGGGPWKDLRVQADDFVAGLELIRRPSRLGLAALWSAGAWATAWIQLALFMAMFGLQGSLVVSLFVAGVVAFGAAVPSSPGALGVYEASAVLGLLVFGFDREAALSVAILWHGLNLGLTALLGAWALARDGQSVAGLAAKAQEWMRPRPDPRAA
jgi:hypothetical protein